LGIANAVDGVLLSPCLAPVTAGITPWWTARAHLYTEAILLHADLTLSHQKGAALSRWRDSDPTQLALKQPGQQASIFRAIAAMTLDKLLSPALLLLLGEQLQFEEAREPSPVRLLRGCLRLALLLCLSLYL